MVRMVPHREDGRTGEWGSGVEGGARGASETLEGV